jgi:FkbM family methyltransferase
MMAVVIRQTYPPNEKPGLGRECRFELSGAAFAAVEFFLEHDGVVYPRPIPTEPDGSVRLFPEAAGAYVLHATWRDAAGRDGRTRVDIRVDGPAVGREPRQVTIDRQTKLWVPTELDSRTIAGHERQVLRELQQIVRPGDIVYDIGANVGLFSIILAGWIGDAGWLYAIEPNPVCVSFLSANFARAGARRFTILPLAVSDRQCECAFTVNYATTFVGAGSDSAMSVPKTGHQIRVDADTLDAIVAAWDFRPPNLIKIDIEGAEEIAIDGMMDTIARHRPTLLIELHGRSRAARTLSKVDLHRYEYRVPGHPALFRTSADLLAWMPDACIQVIGRPLLPDEKVSPDRDAA